MGLVKPKIQILVGPPGSGKSTYAKDLTKQGYVRVNQDDLGKEGHKKLFEDSLKENNNIVLDRMNFNKEQRNRYLIQAKEKNYETEIVVFYESYETCLERISKREDHPTIKDEESAKSALKLFFSKYEKVEDKEADKITTMRKNDSLKELATIVDLDGTLCNISERLHYIKAGGKKEWDKFFGAIDQDIPNTWCATLVNSLFRDNRKIVYCTGRPDKYREVTINWLKRYGLWEQCDNNLFMRMEGDYRQDYIVKEVLLDFEILTRFNPLCFIDDNEGNIKMFKNRGFKTLLCNGDV